jgi:ubiquinol-cytochrome c reductase cytochrome c1 subunit
MRTKLLALAAALAPLAAFAAGGEVHLDVAGTDIANNASLQRGARNFMNYCVGCHSARYVRYNRMAADLGITEQQLIDNLMFTADSPHDTIRNGVRPEDAKRWFGVVPPDLSLIARSRGTDYVYTFLRSFYVDPTKATGTNNRVLPGTAMPHVLWELQGVQKAVWAGEPNAQGDVSHEFESFELVSPGKLTPDEYDAFVRDTVAFLEYAGEPAALQRRALGAPVIAFLAFFTLLAWALKKEYWKDVK